MHRSVTWSDKYDAWARKSDAQIGEAFGSNDPIDRELAERVLHDRYGGHLLSFVKQAVPVGWVQPEDVVQDIWLGLHKTIKAHGVKSGIRQLLWNIAWRKRADAVRLAKLEEKIESNDAFLEDVIHSNAEHLESSLEDLLVGQERLGFLQQLPYTHGLLSDCQRVAWVLRENLDYPPSVVARILGKHNTLISPVVSAARVQMRDYLMELEKDEMREIAVWPSSEGPVIEWFNNPIIPQFTHEELRPLDLTIEEFRANYVASLVLPRFEDAPLVGASDLMSKSPWCAYLLLSRRQDWLTMSNRSRRAHLVPEIDWYESLRVDSLDEQLDALRTEVRNHSDHYLCSLHMDSNRESVIITPLGFLAFAPELYWPEPSLEHLKPIANKLDRAPTDAELATLYPPMSAFRTTLSLNQYTTLALHKPKSLLAGIAGLVRMPSFEHSGGLKLWLELEELGINLSFRRLLHELKGGCENCHGS
jgi:DNA-directed RNA polymerase specialized sigma24 family protein